MTAGGPGVIYLLHLERPYKHAKHYTGWTTDLDARLAEHAAGRGARLLEVVRAAGIGWTLARTWPGTRTRERQIKNQGGAPRRCPECGVRPREDALPVNADGSLSRLRTTDAQKHAAGVMTSTQQAEHTALRQGAYGRTAAEDRGRIQRVAAPSADAVPARDDLWTGRPAGTLPGIQPATEAPQPATEATEATTQPQEGTEVSTGTAAGQAAATGQAGKSGAVTAQQIITAQADAGMTADRIAEHHQDVAASLFSGAETADGQAFAREYNQAGEALVGDLREMERGPEPDRSPGAPHPDARLAGRGWQACEHGHGVYVRRQAQAEADSDPEAA